MIRNILKQIRLLSKTRKEPYLLFYEVLGFYPDKIEYYQLAVRHKSVSNATDTGHLLSNERLEFLGDAVLNAVISEILYTRYPNQREGFLTNTRSKIVKRDSLNKLAIEIGLNKLVEVTKYVNANTNNNIYGNALEALMGAIFLDYGYQHCRKFIEQRLLNAHIDLDSIAQKEINFKSRLIEYCQKKRWNPDFELISETMSSANKHLFVTKLVINGIEICQAEGHSKKESQQNVSRTAIEKIENDSALQAKLAEVKIQVNITDENPDLSNQYDI